MIDQLFALAKDVDFENFARGTPGFTITGVDLKEISKGDISDALERIITGPEKKNAVVSDEKKKLVAYHGTYFCRLNTKVSVFLHLWVFNPFFLS